MFGVRVGGSYSVGDGRRSTFRKEGCSGNQVLVSCDVNLNLGYRLCLESLCECPACCSARARHPLHPPSAEYPVGPIVILITSKFGVWVKQILR